jgi:hypothetical protein
MTTRAAPHRTVVTVISLCVGLIVSALAITSPAQASCAPQAPPSPHVFTGLVVATRLSDRVATVRLDSGETVEVQGTVVTQENEATSADRSYKVGGRYEFHPLNASSPYSDNACTQTVLLKMESAASVGTSSEQVGAVIGDGWSAQQLVTAGVAVLGSALGAWLLTRRRSKLR